MEKTKICFVGPNPNFDGGITLFIKNLINYIKSSNKDVEISWLYSGKKNIKYSKDGIDCFEFKNPKILFLEDLFFNRKVLRFLRKNYFDIINSHAIWGYWMKNYKKRLNQKIIHTYHGVTLPYYKVHLKRFGLFKRILFSPILLYSYLIEKPPIKMADKIICVSEKVKEQIEEVYSKRKNIFVIRTGVDLNKFKERDKNLIRKKIHLGGDKTYGLYIGKGGYWIKGLDRTVKLSEEIYKNNKNYRLIVIGAKYKKVKKIIRNKNFLIFLENIPRKEIPFYYNASDFLFFLSRYEGGAPTLVVSEAMASGCLIIFSKDSEQEIIEDERNGIIIENFDKGDAEKIIQVLKDKKLKEKIINNSIGTIKEFSLENWGRQYF